MSEFITNVKTSIFKKVLKWLGKYSFRLIIIPICFYAFVMQLQTINYVGTIATLIAEQNIEMYQIQAMQYTVMDNAISTINNKVEDLAVTTKTVADTVELASLQRDDKINATLKRLAQKPTYEYLKSITVYLKGKPKDPTAEHGRWGGTGLIIKVTNDETYLLTNKHMCEWEEDSICYAYDVDTKTEYPITLVKSNNFDEDIQVVKFSGHIPGKQAVKGVADSVIQEPVFLCGQNNGTPFVYGEGVVAGVWGDHDLLIQISSTHGNSGSGIINKDGYLVGLVYAGQILADGDRNIGDPSKAICINSRVVRLMVSGILE